MPYRYNSAGKIVDVIEWVYANFLSQGKFPEIKKYSYDNYKEVMCQDDSIDFEYLKRKRIKNALLMATRSFDWIDADIDFGPCFKLIDDRVLNIELNDYSFDVLVNELIKLSKEIIIKNEKDMMGDSINQSILFQAWFDMEKYDAFLMLKEEDVLAERAYNFYMGLIQEKYGLTGKSLKYLVKYLMAANDTSYDKYLQDTYGFRQKAYISLIRQYDGIYVKPENMFVLCDHLKKSKYYKLPYNILNKLGMIMNGISVCLLERDMQDEALICLAWGIEDMHRQMQHQSGLQKQLDELRLEIKEMQQPYLLRKMKAVGRCLHGQGVVYTIKRFIFKVKNFIN